VSRIGFIMARTVGISGSTSPSDPRLATTLVVEAVAVILLGITARLMPG